MPRGKFVNHKGGSRHFSSPEELKQELEKIKAKSSGSDSEGEASGTAATTSKPKKVAAPKNLRDPASGSDSEQKSDDDSEAEDKDAKKGVTSLIDIENPNRMKKKTPPKLSLLDTEDSKPEMSRRQREQLEKQKARQRYEKLHAQGKTAEAKSDLARLALIRQQREEAAAKREAEKKAVEDSKKPEASRFKIV
ncbi:hypothetical protein KR018_008707 [Drosophila ironensis]|nr:hypothetical protein KR018_008707 [Drosophila ironensis]